MTIASLVVDIAANQASLIKAVDQTNQKLDSVTGFAAKVGTALAGAFAAGSVIAMGERVLDFAGKLTDLSAKTGISTTGLQKLGLATEQSGVSIDTVSNATVKLAKSLLDGDKSTVGALGKLGLSLDDLKKMAPEQQFLKVADAVGGIQNPTEKAWAAMQIFGKGGAELLSALDGHLSETAQRAEDLGLIIDEKTVKAADDFGDQLGLLGKQLLGIVATVIGPLLPALSALGNALSWLGREVIGPVLGTAVKSAMWLFYGLLEAVANTTSTIAKFGAKLPGVGKYVQQYADLQSDVAGRVRELRQHLFDTTDQTDKSKTAALAAAPALIGLGKASETAGKDAARQASELARLNEKILQINASVAAGLYAKGGDMGAGAVESEIVRAKAYLDAASKADAVGAGMQSGATMAVGVQLDIEDAKQALDTLNIMASKSLGGILTRIVGGLPQTLQQAFTGGGGMTGAIKSMASQFGAGIGEQMFSAGGALNGVGNKLAGVFGNAFGLALPGIGSALGALAGPILGKVTGAIAGLFSSTEKQVNPVRQAFVDAAGGLDALNQKASSAGMTLRAMLDAKTPEAYKKAIDDLNAAFEFQSNAMKTLDETTQRYGFTLEELGPALQRQELDKQAQQLYQDFQVLTAAGIDIDTVLGRMGTSINAFVAQSLRTGTEVPAALAPVLQRMVELGQLTDENGNIISDLEQSGVRFAMTMSEGFQALIGSVTRLTEAIGRGLGVALDSLPTETNLDVNINYNERGRPSGLPDPLRDVDVTPMADGGYGRVTGPTLFLAGEAGSEDFAFSGGGQRFGSVSRSDGSGSSELSAKVDRLYAQTAALTDYMTSTFSRDLARTTRDEMQKLVAVRR